MRQLLKEIRSVVVEKKKPSNSTRAMILCQSPRTSFLIDKLLSYLGIRTTLLTSAMKQSQRETEIERFNSDECTADVPITPFSLDIAGHDCHRRCSTAIVVEPAYNWATEHQFCQRLFRLRQTEDVNVACRFSL